MLLWLFLFPLLGALVPLLLSKTSLKLQKFFALLLSLFPLGLLIYGQGTWEGEEVRVPWLPPLSIEFHLKVDSLSILFLYLTALITPFSILVIRSKTMNFPHFFYALVLFLQGLLVGFFTARDLALFTLFWEAMLLPLYFIINLWGGKDRQSASLKFLIYMIVGSVFMVAAVLALYSEATHSFNLDVLEKGPHAGWLFAIFALAFAVKTPLFPFHAWLSDAYCEAPWPGTILLAAVLSKAGIYGFLRIGHGLFLEQMHEWSLHFIGFAIAGVLYGALAAWKQNDFKRLLAYSSFSHVNFILVGIFALNQTGYTGAILQSLNHAITITALFLVAGWLQERIQTTSIGEVQGLAKFLPILCWLTLLFVLSSVAIPGTNNFVGEIMIFLSLFQVNPWLMAIFGLSIILSVIYMLRFMRKIFFEAPGEFHDRWVDIGVKELLIASPLIFLIFFIGIYPTPILRLIRGVI